MQNPAYRLAEFKIIESEHGDLWWETHMGLGSLKSGKCFINGDILFIAPSDSTGPGFLKGEFIDHLNRLPKWEKTKYYCASYKIYECKSGSRISFFQGLDVQAILGKNGSSQRAVVKTRPISVKSDIAEIISYKLGRYEIKEMNHGQMVWKSPGGFGTLKKGRCYIKGSILFLEPGESEPSRLMKSEFMQHLNRLPDWERTKFFCPSCAIYYSSTSAICRRFGEEQDLKKGTGPKNTVVQPKAYGAGIKFKPTIVNQGDIKQKLTALFKFCKLVVILLLKMLFGCSQMVYAVSRALIDKWRRSRG